MEVLEIRIFTNFPGYDEDGNGKDCTGTRTVTIHIYDLKEFIVEKFLKEHETLDSFYIESISN